MEVISLNAFELTTLTNTIANILAEDKSVEEIEVLAALFYQLSQTLTTIALINTSTQE
jgi:hypothetical protein